jgi:hypothetical protein
MLTANLRMAGMQAISASIWLQNQWQGPSLILLPVFAQLLLHFLGLGFHWNSMAATAPLVAGLAFALGKYSTLHPARVLFPAAQLQLFVARPRRRRWRPGRARR